MNSATVKRANSDIILIINGFQGLIIELPPMMTTREDAKSYH